jgi:timeless
LVIERILVLTRNVLQVPTSPDRENRAENDASVHDQVLWALHQSGMMELILYVVSSEHENSYHLHALEIICLMYREQNATSLADASLQRSDAEKYRDEQELVVARKLERQKALIKLPPVRHSRFGGTYVMQNIKSISDNDLICHQPLERAVQMDFDLLKTKAKKSHRVVKEEGMSERRSAFAVRLFLREYSVEILNSAYNTMVKQLRRVLESNAGIGHDDSYLLWAIRFFMEFNRASGFKVDLVSESMSTTVFHWILTRMEHHLEMITSDKRHARLWARRLHIGIQAYRELLLSLLVLKRLPDEASQALYSLLENNVFYVMEYREIVIHLLINFNEAQSTK